VLCHPLIANALAPGIEHSIGQHHQEVSGFQHTVTDLDVDVVKDSHRECVGVNPGHFSTATNEAGGGTYLDELTSSIARVKEYKVNRSKDVVRRAEEEHRIDGAHCNFCGEPRFKQPVQQ